MEIYRAKSPLRVSFSGGATDIEPYMIDYGGCVLSTTINKYCYATLIPREDNQVIIHSHDFNLTVKYELEQKDHLEDDLRLVRAVVKRFDIKQGFELSVLCEAPVGSGLGTSSSLVVCLVGLFCEWLNIQKSPYEIAKLSYEIERIDLGISGGHQDQYASAFGGLNFIEFYADRVVVNPINIEEKYLNHLKDNLLMCYSGNTRMGGDIIKNQVSNYEDNVNHLHELKDITYKMKDVLQIGDLDGFGNLLHTAWENKRKLSNGISNSHIDNMYESGKNAGALGGKLCFTPDTLVTTPVGQVAIKDIEIGQEIIDAKTNKEIVTDKMINEYHGNILKIKVRGMQEEIKTTPEHPFMLTMKDHSGKRVNRKLPNIAIFKEARELKKGDCLLYPIDMEIKDVDFIDRDEWVEYCEPSIYASNNPYKDIPKNIQINYDMLNLIGWYVAEGSKGYKQFNFALNSREIQEIESIRSSLSNLFNKQSTVKKNGENGVQIVVSSKVLTQLFSNLCGDDSLNKKFPDFIMKLPIEKQSIVLRSVWLGDGCERISYDKRYDNEGERCHYTTVSYELAKQIQTLCHRLGYITGFSVSQETNNNFCDKPALKYRVYIDGDDAKSFTNFIKTGEVVPVVRKNKKQLFLRKEIIEIDGVKYVKRAIISIEEENYDGLVYNLEVTGSHTYIANNIAVHNCGAGGGGYLLFYCPEKEKVSKALLEKGFEIIDIKFEKEGLTTWKI